MIGYHYTSFENWQRIRHEGLRPYVLRKDIVSDGVPGIWLFLNQQYDESHAGCIFFQIKTKRTFHVVELQVNYRQSWCRRNGWNDFEILHEGMITDDRGGLIGYYHKDARATIAWQPIPPECIQLVGEYEFKRAWKRDEPISVGLHEQAGVRKFTP